jgi:hypothetical protein
MFDEEFDKLKVHFGKADNAHKLTFSMFISLLHEDLTLLFARVNDFEVKGRLAEMRRIALQSQPSFGSNLRITPPTPPARRSGRSTPLSSGGATPTSRPKSGLGTPHVPESKPPDYYFNKLKEHFKHHNTENKFELKYSKYKCMLKRGKDIEYEISVDPTDSTSVRNLYLMMHDSRYNPVEFLKKVRSGEYGDFSGVGLTTPPP